MRRGRDKEDSKGGGEGGTKERYREKRKESKRRITDALSVSCTIGWETFADLKFSLYLQLELIPQNIICKIIIATLHVCAHAL